MKKIKKIGVFSFAKFQAVLGALMGMVCGVIYAFGGLIIDALVTVGWLTTTETPGLSFGTVLAFGALIGMPFIGAVAGFLFGIVEAVLYNIFAKWYGGLPLHFE